MAKFNQKWVVGTHGPLEQLAENLWVVDGQVPRTPLDRRMTIVQRDDKSLVIHNGIAVNDDVRAQIDSLGPVSLIIIPNSFHRLDAPAFKAAYPDAKVACPRGARRKAEEATPIDATFDQLENDTSLAITHFEGVHHAEGALIVNSADGRTLIVNDLIFNLPHRGGLFGLLYGRLLGNTGGAKITTVGRMLLVKDKAALKTHLHKLAELGIERLIMSHGEVIRSQASAVLRQLAETL